MMLVITLVLIVLWVCADLAYQKYILSQASYIHIAFYFRKSERVNTRQILQQYYTCIVKSVTLNVENCGQEITNVVIYTGGKFCENVGKTFHVGIIFTILLLFPS